MFFWWLVLEALRHMLTANQELQAQQQMALAGSWPLTAACVPQLVQQLPGRWLHCCPPWEHLVAAMLEAPEGTKL